MLATLGQPIFESLTNAPTSRGEIELFYCRGSGADGVGEYTTEGFVVLKGSQARLEIVPSLQDTARSRNREKLIEEGILVKQSEALVFTRDHLFGSPSTAASIVMGRSANGWDAWRAANGKTLDEVKRQSVKVAD